MLVAVKVVEVHHEVRTAHSATDPGMAKGLLPGSEMERLSREILNDCGEREIAHILLFISFPVGPREETRPDPSHQVRFVTNFYSV